MSDCDCPTGSPVNMKPLHEALELLLSHARPPAATEWIPSEEGLDRVLSEPLNSAIDVPAWDNSAMDGYAVRSADLSGGETLLRVSQRIPAGCAARPLESGSAARIFTGAPIPDNADAVVVQERAEPRGDRVLIPGAVPPGANIRRAGEDLRRGQVILEAGTRLQPQHLGLAASVGIDRLPVYARIKVALFSSGDELVMPGTPLGPGQIYNSNRFTLAGLVKRLGCEQVDLGGVEDTFDATCDALVRAAEQSDLILSSGGVSVGEEDHVKPAVETLGSLELWKIAIRPGKPLAFGHVNGTPFIGSPGNPVSLFVTFCLFARPFILRSQGVRQEIGPVAVKVQAQFDWPKPDRRREFVRARLQTDAQGRLGVSAYPSRSSGVLSSVTWANGLVVIPEGRIIKRGELVDFLPFDGLLT